MGISIAEVLPYFMTAAQGDARLAWYGLLVAMRETGGGANVGVWGKSAEGNASRNLGAITGTGDAGFFIHGDSRPGPNGPIKYETKFRCYSSYAAAAADIIKFLRDGARRGVSTGSLLAATAGQYRDGYYTGIKMEKWKNIADYYKGHHRNALKSKALCPPGGWLEPEPTDAPAQVTVQTAWDAMMGGPCPIASQAKPVGPALPLVPGAYTPPPPPKVTPATYPPQGSPPATKKGPAPKTPPATTGNRTGPNNPPIKPNLVAGKGYQLLTVAGAVIGTLAVSGGSWAKAVLSSNGRELLAAAQAGAEPIGLVTPKGRVFRVADAAGSWHTPASILESYKKLSTLKGHGFAEHGDGWSPEVGDPDLTADGIAMIPTSWIFSGRAAPPASSSVQEQGDPFVGPSWMYGKGDSPPPPPPKQAPPLPAPPKQAPPIRDDTPVPVQKLPPQPKKLPPDQPPPIGPTELDPPDPPPLGDLLPPVPVKYTPPVPPPSQDDGSEEEILSLLRELAAKSKTAWIVAAANDPGPWLRLARDLTRTKRSYQAVKGGKTFYGYHSINATFDQARLKDIGLLAGLRAGSDMSDPLVKWPRQGLLALVHLKWFERYVVANYTMQNGSAWDLRPATQHGRSVAATAVATTTLGEALLRAFWAGSSPAGVAKGVLTSDPLGVFPGPDAPGVQ